MRSLHEQREWLDRIHIELTGIPAPTFLESMRASYMTERFRELGLERVRVDAAGNLLGERPGTKTRGRFSDRAELLTAPPGSPVPGAVFLPGCPALAKPPAYGAMLASVRPKPATPQSGLKTR